MGQFYLLGRKLKAVHETTVIHHLVKFQIYPPVKRFMRDDPRRLSNFTIIYEPDFSSTTSFVLSCFKSVLPLLRWTCCLVIKVSWRRNSVSPGNIEFYREKKFNKILFKPNLSYSHVKKNCKTSPLKVDTLKPVANCRLGFWT